MGGGEGGREGGTMRVWRRKETREYIERLKIRKESATCKMKLAIKFFYIRWTEMTPKLYGTACFGY